MGSGKMREGDYVAVQAGTRVPIVVMPVESVPIKFRVVGPCYVNGIMHGEAVATLQACGELVDFYEMLVLV
jgi:hypothetical protein